MENQQPAGEAQNSQKPIYRKWWGVILIILFLPVFAIWYVWAKTAWSKTAKWIVTVVIVIFSMGVIGSTESNNNQPTQQAPVEQPAPAAQETDNNSPTSQASTPAQDAAPAAPTDQASLEKYLTSIISSASPDMSLKNVDVEKSDPDRPAGTQMVGVNITVNNFSSTDAIMTTTEKLTSSIYQTVFSMPSMKAYDVIVFYDTGMNNAPVDRYGNKQSGGISNSIDKPTYAKINWQNFDQTTLCDVLRQENKVTNQDSAACLMLGNAQ